MTEVTELAEMAGGAGLLAGGAGPLAGGAGL